MVFVRAILYFLSGFAKRSQDIYIFGAWFGKRFSDNPKYLLYEMLAESNLRHKKFIWVGDPDTWPAKTTGRITFVKRNSLQSFIYQLRAGKAFFSHGYQDFGSINLLRRAVTYQLWHGFPIKHIGSDDPKNADEGKHSYERYQYFLADSKLMSSRIESGFKNYGASKTNIIIATQPRVDYLQENQENDKLIHSIKKKMGISLDKKVYTYLPTFRDNSSQFFSFSRNVDLTFQNFLKQENGVLLERQHFARDQSMFERVDIDTNRFINLSESVEVQEVLLITDYLITDFSSVFVDFTILNRPIVHFLYDGANYINQDRGVYIKNIVQDFAGPVVYTIDELIDELEKPSSNFSKYIEKRKLVAGVIPQQRLIDKIRIDEWQGSGGC